ncbi:hypothetical protein ABPG72_000699 [Tetrahymena utriculariae]
MDTMVKNQEISNLDQERFCQEHNKELKYLNYQYKKNSYNIFICKQCTKDLGLQKPLNIKKILEGKIKRLKSLQEMNYKKVKSNFQIYEENLKAVEDQIKKHLSDQHLMTQVYIDEAKQKVKSDQKNISYDIQQVVKSFNSGLLGLSEFQQEMAELFQREDSFQNFKSKRFQIFNEFLESFCKISKKFTTEMSQIQCQNFEKEEPLIYNPTSSQIQLISDNLKIFEFNKQVEQYSKQGNLNFLHKYETIPNNIRILKQIKQKPKEILIKTLERPDQIKVIITKNTYSQLSHITQSLALLKPFYQQLQILHINNYTKANIELNQLVQLLSEQSLIQLRDLSFGINKQKTARDNQTLSKYFSEFSSLYPNIQNISLNLGKQNFDEIIRSITYGLDPVKKQLTSLQLKVKVKQQMDPDLIESFYQNILNQSTQLKILSLKFLKNKLDSQANFIQFFQGFSQVTHQYNQLKVVDLQIDSLGKGIINVNELASFIQNQKQLQKLKLFFDSCNNFEYFSSEQASQIINSISNHQHLISLVLKFVGLYSIQKESLLNLSKIIEQNKQIEELNLKFPKAQKIDDEVFVKLSCAVKDLQKISKLRFNMSLALIQGCSLNFLVESLAHTNKLKEFELNLKNSKQIQDKPILNLVDILSNQKQLQKMLLNFEKNQKINPKILQQITKHINEGSFQKLRNISILLGSEKFDSQTVVNFIKSIKSNLVEFRLFLGNSLFSDEVQCIFKENHKRVVNQNFKIILFIRMPIRFLLNQSRRF